MGKKVSSRETKSNINIIRTIPPTTTFTVGFTGAQQKTGYLKLWQISVYHADITSIVMDKQGAIIKNPA